MSKNNYKSVSLGGLLTGASLAVGMLGISDSYSQRDSVRDAVYARADEITPEIITNAEELSNTNGSLSMVLTSVGLGLTGFFGAIAISELRKE